MSFYGLGYCGYQRTYRDAQDNYTRALKLVDRAFGINPGQIDQLLEEGFTHEGIEDCIYCGEM